MRINFQSMPTFSWATVFAAAAIAVACSINSVAQQPASEITLDIGSKAPALDIETWISDGDGVFEPVTEFESGKIYVVEFWATWCGPCIASMPHLAETQERHIDDGVQIISVTDEDMDTVDVFLARNVRGEDALSYQELTSAYCLTADPDQSTSDDYMRAAGQNGIPTAFIVGKSGLIEWTGHPMKLEKPLQAVIDDKWDRDAFKVEMEEKRKRQAAQRKITRQLRIAMGEVKEKVSEGDQAGALSLMNELVENEQFGPMRPQLMMIRAELALAMDGPDALAAYEAGVDAVKSSPGALNQIAWAAVEAAGEGKEVAASLLSAALKAAQKALEADPKDPSVLDTVAHLHHLNGDLDQAIASQELAVKNAGELAPQIKPFLNQLKAEKAAQ